MSDKEPIADLPRLTNLNEIAQSWRIPSIELRIKFFVTGVLFPASSIIFVSIGFGVADSPWQSGNIPDYVAMLLTWPALLPFVPLICFSAMCLTAYCIRPTLARTPVVMIGIAGGAVLALQYFAFVCLVTPFISVAVALVIGPLVAGGAYCLCHFAPLIKRFTIRHVLILTTVAAVLSAMLLTTNAQREVSSVFYAFAVALFWCAVAAPTLNAITYVRVCIYALKDRGKIGLGIPLIGGIVGWIVSWAVSWKFGVDAMITEYSKLPVTDPSCYVSSAAAHGHRKFVRSQWHPMGCVNLQMQRLKFLEFALAVAAPKLHQRIRQIYNERGPTLARVCKSNVWFADATYITLKPLELCAVTLRKVLRTSKEAIRQIYL